MFSYCRNMEVFLAIFYTAMQAQYMTYGTSYIPFVCLSITLLICMAKHVVECNHGLLF